MSGIKISALPAAASSLLTDIVPAVQAGVTVSETLSQIVTLFNSNIVLASTAQVTGLPASLASFLPLSGGVMTGQIDMGNHKIINLANPTNAQDAATMSYVQTFATGITVILSAAAATTANLNATAAGAGIGATLTNAGAMAAFAVDGYNANVNDRILVKNQTAAQHNGVYSVTTVGSGAVNWVLTRTTDYDTAAQIKPGTLIAVNNGTANANTSWLETATVVTVDTDPISFSQFTFAPTSFFLISNNLSEGNPATMRTNLGLTGAATMTLPVSGTNGGTGVNNGANTITLGGNISTAGTFTLSGAFAATFTFTNTTTLTFPTTGTLITSSQPTINQPNIVGVTSNSNAAAGSVGEYISSVIAVGSSISMPNNSPKSITSISLTAGDWDVWGEVYINSAGSTQINLAGGAISTINNSLPATIPSDVSALTFLYAPVSQFWTAATSGVPTLALTPCRISISGTTTVYLVGQFAFTVSTLGAYGKICARRIR